MLIHCTDKIMQGVIPYCSDCNSLIKPDVVFFGGKVVGRGLMLLALPLLTRCNVYASIPVTPCRALAGEVLPYGTAGNKWQLQVQIVLMMILMPSHTQDFTNCDLLIVLGTSLKVRPFNQLIGLVGESTPRLLINREQVGLASDGTLDPRAAFRFDECDNSRDVYHPVSF